jgi:hypothetical protein
MSLVVVERSFAEPVAFDEIQAAEDRSRACLDVRGVRFVRSYFSRDRRRMICLSDAPDAESVRDAQAKAGLPYERAWASRSIRHAAAEPEGDAIVVERTLASPMDEPAIHDAAARGAWCRDVHGCRIVWSYLSSDARRMVCVFAGPDAESVRQTQRTTGMPFDAAWPATVHEPPAAAP